MKLSIKNLLPMLLMATVAFTFTSCDEDDDIAYTLEGTWRGNMYMQSSYNGVTYDAAYSEICFLRDPYRYSSGDGYWVDHYSRAPWDYVANHISWKVNNGVIRVYLIEEGSYLEIHDYRLNDNYFFGTIYLGDSYVDFELRHVSSPNWNNYEYWYDDWYDDWYYSKPGMMRAPKTGKAEKPVRSLRL